MRVETRLTFEKIQQIGEQEGRNSKVFLAKDIQLDANIVIKEIPKNKFTEQDKYYAEARNLYSSKHPNIVEVNYACEDENNIYFSMPFYPNGSLNTMIEQRFLTVREIINYSLQFMGGIHYIHTKGLIHFDIKPTNILINNSNVALLTDFGLAKYIDQYGLATPESELYSSHTPPEYNTGEDLDFQSDVYQCGLTLYRMCNGNEGFHYQWRKKLQTKEQRAEAIANGTFPDRSGYLPHIPKQLIKIINCALEVNDTKRYKNILDMINDLGKIDKNLDWVYNYDKSNRTHVWTINEEKTIKRIILICNKKGVWSSSGESESISTGKKQTVNAWNKEKYKDINEAFKEIAKMISSY
ncbi:serine/threonine-protein kinase [Ferdinandcohnia sp. SAFN-114]|uniref:serine/threonine-protein kinase n=1 Tax=Ferdinandcohnia sp. SAFN-114 TaxID=3387275 RepID=UPI003F7D296F